MRKQHRAHGTPHTYNDRLRADIGKYAAENGNIAAVRKYSKLLGHAVPESTVRGFKKRYQNKLEETKEPVTSLPHASKGRPLKLGRVSISIILFSSTNSVVNKQVSKCKLKIQCFFLVCSMTSDSKLCSKHLRIVFKTLLT